MMCPTKHIANTWQRLLTYPVVQEGIRRFQDHRFGQLAIQVTSTIYKIGSPVLSVLQGPYNRLLAGYIEKVDSFGEQTLSKAEERFPVMKKSTPEIIEEAKTVGTERQIELAQELNRLIAEQLYGIGTVGLTPMIQGVVVVNANLANVPDLVANDWPLRTPGDARPETFFYRQ